MTAIRPAIPSDFEAAADLLRGASLPLDGLADHFSHALVAEAEAESGARLVGCVALELYGKTALLRSLAVASERRGEGLGRRLAAAAVSAAKESGARDVYLLTQTADRFFSRLGFCAQERRHAPEVLARSEEFRTACPASAVMMHLKMTP